MLAALALAVLTSFPTQSPPAKPADRGAADTPPDPRAAFTAELDAVHAKLRKRDWKGVQKGLDALLARHANSDVARGKLLEIEDLARLAAFWAKHPEPDPRNLVAGQVEQIDRGGDLVRLSYERGRTQARNAKRPKYRPISVPAFGDASAKPKSMFGRPAPLPDFDAVGELSVHPLQFHGPWSAEMRGSIPERGGEAPAIVVVLDSDEILVASFGNRFELTRFTSTKDGPEALASEKPHGVALGEDFKVEVSVSESNAVFRSKGRIVFQTPKPKTKFGWFGYLGGSSVKYVQIGGKTQGQWLDALVDAAVAEDRERFERAFDARAVLPAWLFEVPDSAVSDRAVRDEEGEKAAVERVEKGFSPALVQKMSAQMSSGRFAEALETLDEADGLAAKPIARSWMRARLLARLDRLSEARDEAARVAAEEPKHYEARFLEAGLTMRLERSDAATDKARALVRDFPASADAREVLVNALLRRGRLEDAQHEAERAFAAGVERERASKLVRQMRRAVAGPSWRTSNRHESEHYAVASDMDRATCTQLAKVLEETYAYFRTAIGPLPDGRPRMRVFVFSGKQGYFDYCEDLIGEAMHSTQGLFSAELAQLLFWNAVDRQDFIEVARHEAFHQYLSELVPEVPVWLNEGLARYYETLRKEKGKFVAGAVPSSSREVLREFGRGGTWPTLPQLFAVDSSTFYGQDAAVWYALSWCVVHTLAEGTPEDRERFDALIGKLARGVDGAVAVREALDGADLAALLERVKARAKSL